MEDFKFFGEHFKTACGAIVVPGAVVRNYWSSVFEEQSINWIEMEILRKPKHEKESLAGPYKNTANKALNEIFSMWIFRNRYDCITISLIIHLKHILAF